MRNREKQSYSMELENTKKYTIGTLKVLNKILSKNKVDPKNDLKYIIDCKTDLNTPKEIANGLNQ